MRIVKVLNNNVVVVQDDDHQEKVVMGKGLGFQMKPGSEVDPQKIEKVFTLENANNASATTTPEGLSSIPPELYQICRDFVNLAGQRLQLSFHNSLTLALADHLFYALQRLIRGEHVVNALLQEIQQFYPAEYNLGLEALELIKKQTGLNLPLDEALIADILTIVKSQLGISAQEHSLDYTRFITHLKFFAHRLIRKEQLPQDVDFLFDEVKKHYPVSYNCVQRIGLYVKQHFGHEISKDEITFLTVHIERVRNATKK